MNLSASARILRNQMAKGLSQSRFIHYSRNIKPRHSNLIQLSQSRGFATSFVDSIKTRIGKNPTLAAYIGGGVCTAIAAGIYKFSNNRAHSHPLILHTLNLLQASSLRGDVCPLDSEDRYLPIELGWRVSGDIDDAGNTAHLKFTIKTPELGDGIVKLQVVRSDADSPWIYTTLSVDFPDCSRRYSFDVDSLPPGPLSAAPTSLTETPQHPPLPTLSITNSSTLNTQPGCLIALKSRKLADEEVDFIDGTSNVRLFMYGAGLIIPVLFFRMGLKRLRRTQLIRRVKKQAPTNSTILKQLGEPVEVKQKQSGGFQGETMANFTVRLTGASRDGKLRVQAIRDDPNGDWTVTSTTLQVDGRNKPVQVPLELK